MEKLRRLEICCASMPQSPRKRTPMSREHKAALAEGRDQGRAVRRYLEALEAHKPRRGRKRTPDSIKRRLTAVESEYASADPLKRLHLAQERLDLKAALAASVVLHQAAVFAAVFARASWFAAAIRILEETRPSGRPSGTMRSCRRT